VRSRHVAAAVGAIVGGVTIALVPGLASAHVERASYWPDPGAETVDGEVVGGDVPDTRSLFGALDAGAVGETRVVCMPTPGDTPGGGPATPTVDSAQAATKGKKKKKKKKKRKRKKKKQQQKRQFQATAAELAALQDHPSMQRLDQSIAQARTNGVVIRPSEGPVFERVNGDTVGPGAAWNAYLDALRAFNLELLAQCNYNSIQRAVNDSGNNDRVVVMPGVYTEPESRAVPDYKSQNAPEWQNNPCKDLVERNDTGSTGALSYRYQFHCPNHQNLIAVMGRAPDKDATNGDANGEEEPPFPSASDPRKDGIPDADGQPDGGGHCIRCNLQLEGSGISPDDVVVDSGRVESGNGAPMESDKDIGIRADRADGFVLRNMTVRHSEEHDIYSPETDGLLLERFKTYFNGHYGVLTFVADNHLIQDCDAAGSGDAAIYPGSSAEKGEQRNDRPATPFDADDQAVNHTMNDPSDPDGYSTEIRRCDMRHSNTGYSGTAGNSVWIHHNDFYDNAMGLVTDVFTASGHPGFPQDSDLIEDNEFYSNNFNLYVEDENGNLNVCDSANGENPGPHGPNQGCTDVIPRIPAPVGTAMFLPGVNNNTIRNNHMWNNWRRGTMLFAVPDSFVCGNVNPIAGGNQQYGCDETEFNTSHRNEQRNNVMGRSPNHASDPTWDDYQGGSNTPDAEDPNGLDFWWDQGGTPGAANYKNCWVDNTGAEGDEASVSSLPAAPLLPGESGSVQSCATSAGAGSTFGQFGELIDCLGKFEFDTPGACTWFATPTEPQPD
jgi:hypothetical protein